MNIQNNLISVEKTNLGFQNEIIKEAKCFTEKYIRPFAGNFEEDENFPIDLIKKMAAKGYLAACLPKKYDGLGLDQIHYGLFTEEIGKGGFSAGTLLTVHTSLFCNSLLRWGTEYQKEIYLKRMTAGKLLGAFALSEPNFGSDARNIKTNYVYKNNKFILNGKKKWISFGDLADVFLIAASNPEGKISTFIVNRNAKGLKTVPMKGLLAAKASHIAEIYLDDVEISEENILGIQEEGFTYIINSALDHGRYSIAWTGVAIAQAALEEMVTYARNRSQFGKKICSFQLVQGIIAENMANISAARALCLRAGALRDEKDENAVTETIAAKYFASKVAMKTTTDAVQIHGGNGFYNKYPVERLFREAKAFEIIEGSSQILQTMLSKNALTKFYRS